MLPLYKSHKLVRAAKVVDVITDVNGYDYSFKLDTGDQVPPPKGKHDPNPVGGYYVEYEDGYTSWSPAAAFESGHIAVDTAAGFGFGMAIAMMAGGLKVARTGWNGKGMWIALQEPDEHSKMRRPYLYMSPADGQLVPWLASQSDMLAHDWVIVE